MASELWTHQFCLACDKQVHVDGAAYCSESCRLADQETTSTPTSRASSPGFPPAGWSVPWTAPPKPKFYLSPAYDFSNAQPYSIALPRSQSVSTHAASRSDSLRPVLARNLDLSPSSSHSSLCSMQSTSTSTSDSSNLSDSARQELKAYAISFENVRLQRRRSY